MPHTILIVEDDNSVLQYMKIVLTYQFQPWPAPDYEVLAADSPEKGLEMAAEFQGPIHLLLTDVVMHGMFGTELAERLQKQRPDMRVILVSGWPNREIRVERDYRTWRFIQKPFMPEDLLEAVRSELNRPLACGGGGEG